MRIPVRQRTRRDERGVVLIVVLIVASIFAVLAYTALAVSINSLDSTDAHRNTMASKQVAEGSLNEAAYRLTHDTNLADPQYIDPEFALSTSEESLKALLLTPEYSTSEILDQSPSTIGRMAYTVEDPSDYLAGASDLIPGDRDNAVYRFMDDSMFSQDYPGYEFTQANREGNLAIYGVGQVDQGKDDPSLFSFVRGSYQNLQANYDMREAGVTEPSRLGPYPYIETWHPYDNNLTRSWVVSHKSDPAHSGRNITGIRLMAGTDGVAIDNGDKLYVSGWIESQKRFQNLGEILPGHVYSGYTNGTNKVFTQDMGTTTLAMFFQSDDTSPSPGYDYGFRVDGIRYRFDSDYYPAYYETPHPYDSVIVQSNPADLGIQAIYSPFQAGPLDPMSILQTCAIQFDDKFSLDSGDTLYLFNTSDPNSVTAVATYTQASPPPAGGWSPTISRVNLQLPLGFLLFLVRGDSNDTDGILNYGYKVSAIEYTDSLGTTRTIPNPTVETPHNSYLSANNTTYNIPAIVPFPVPGGLNLAGYQTIYKPSVPNTDSSTGEGSVTEWFVSFSDACDLTATSGATNGDYIRIQTPGNVLAADGMTLFDTLFFLNSSSSLGALIGTSSQYRDITELKNFIVECGTADYMQIDFVSDPVDGYEGNIRNYGYKVARVGYLTDDGADDNTTPPTIRSEMNYPQTASYPSYGDGPLEAAEWWYENKDALVVGLHFDRDNLDIDPGDRIEVYDANGILIATVISDSLTGGPGAGGPVNPDEPTGGQQPGHGPGAGGPNIPETSYGTVVDLSATYGWVLVPGVAAKVKLVGDGDDNDGYAGFEIDHCGYVNGDVTQIHSYVTEYTQVAYDKYYDRSSGPIQAFRSLGVD